jgi:hypothetical protein
MMDVDLVFPVLFLAALAAVARATLGSWLAPGAFFPLFWTGLFVLSLGANDYYPLWAPALWWIDFSLLLFYLGGLAGKLRMRAAAEQPRRSTTFQLPQLERVVILCSVIGILYPFFRERYAPDLMDTPPSWYQIFLGMLYAAPLFGGVLFAEQTSRRAKAISLFSLVPALFYALASMGRSQLVLGIFFWAASYWGTKIYRCQGKVRLINPQMAMLALVFLVCAYVIGAVLGRLRDVGHLPLSERLASYSDVLERAELGRDLENFRGSVFGHPYAFSYYLNRTIDFPPTPRLGGYLFAGPLDLLGIQERTPFENFALDTGVQSNVYTLFRPPIEDFGLIGSFVSFLFAGLIAGFAYSGIATGNIRWLPILTMFYPHVMVVGGLFFAYNSFTLAHCLLAAYLLWAVGRSRESRRSSPVFSNSMAPLAATSRANNLPLPSSRASRCEPQS